MKFNIIGAGNLGKNLAYALSQSGLAELGAVCNRSLESGLQAIAAIGAGKAVATLAELPAADITFITTSDEQISLLASQLIKHNPVIANSIIAHCSGVLDSSVLNIDSLIPCKTASIHPLKPFRAEYLTKDNFCQCYCVIEGDEQAVATLTDLFEALGAILVPLNKKGKAVYHAAAVVASNYMVTLAATAHNLFKESGISDESAQQIVISLMSNSLDNIVKAPTYNKALTGPLTRGDLATLHRHLDALHDPVVNAFYRAAAEATLPVTALADEVKARCRQLLRRE